MAWNSGVISPFFSCRSLHGEAVLRARVDDREIELLVGRFELNEKIENHIDNLMRSRVFSVDLVNHKDRLKSVFQCLAQDETCLRLRAVVGVNN